MKRFQRRAKRLNTKITPVHCAKCSWRLNTISNVFAGHRTLTSSRWYGSCLPGRTGCLYPNLHWSKVGDLTRQWQLQLDSVSTTEELRCLTELTFAFSVGIQDFCMSDPLHVAMKVLIQLLPFSQLLELSSGSGLFPLFSKLSVWNRIRGKVWLFDLCSWNNAKYAYGEKRG